MSGLTASLKSVKERAELSIQDTAAFCEVNHGTLRTWLAGVEPQEHRLPLILQGVDMIRYALKEKLLPVPRELTQYNRRDYIEEIRDALLGRISESRFINRKSPVWRLHKPEK